MAAIDMRNVGLEGKQLEKAGDFFVRRDAAGPVMVIALPYKNDKGWAVTEWTIDHKNHCDAQWTWDGDEKRPTMKPSLHWVGVWHGWVRAGRLVEV